MTAITVSVTDALGAVATASATFTVQASGTVPMPALTTGAGLALRPFYNGGTHVLMWQGPVGGGPSNGDYTLQTATLTVVGGSITSTGPNTIIELKYATGNPAFQINHNNVTIRRCVAQITPANTDGSYAIYCAQGVTGLIVEDCYIDANANSNEGNGVSGDQTQGPGVTGCTIRRCNAFRCGQLVRFILNNVSVTENYCHEFSGADADHVEVYPVGGVCNHLLIQHNYFTGPDNSVQGADSAINLSPGAGLPGGTIGPDVVIDSNWFVWTQTVQNIAWQSHSICNGIGGRTGGNQERLTFSCTNNGIYNVAGGYGGPTLMGSESSGSATSGGGLISPCSGNYVMATPTSTTGVPYPGINGPGQL